jgi:hypothetical protein
MLGHHGIKYEHWDFWRDDMYNCLHFHSIDSARIDSHWAEFEHQHPVVTDIIFTDLILM